MTDQFETMSDESEVLSQLDPELTLVDRGIADQLDEGYVTPEKWSVAMRVGTTAEDMRRRVTLEERMAQEEPEPTDEDVDWRYGDEPREVGRYRAGRLVAAGVDWEGADHEDQAIGQDVGIDGGAASAEEAAMHIISEDDENDDD